MRYTDIYPKKWALIRKMRLEQAGYRCEHCGARHKLDTYATRSGKEQIVYLQVAHVKLYQTWNPHAETMVLCPPCHLRYDVRWRKLWAKSNGPILGYARLYPENSRNAILPVTISEMLREIERFSINIEFSITLEINQCQVGEGWYKKTSKGIITLQQTDACEDLPFNSVREKRNRLCYAQMLINNSPAAPPLLTGPQIRAFVQHQKLGQKFDVAMISNEHIVGAGSYIITKDGVGLIDEQGAADGLGVYFPSPYLDLYPQQ